MHEPKQIGIGMLGYGFMGRTHSSALMRVDSLFYPQPTSTKLVGVTGPSETRRREFAERYHYQRTFGDWHSMLADPEIDVLDNAAPNDMHLSPCLEAAQRGKHVICEKPLARDSEESLAMLDSVRSSNVKHMAGFNFRFVPAVRLAWDLIKQGKIGTPYMFRGQFLSNYMHDPKEPVSWRTSSSRAGSGSLLDLGSHVIDLARFLIGDPRNAFGVSRTFTKERPIEKGSKRMAKVETEDSFSAILGFDSDIIGIVEASRVSAGHSMHLTLEINGSKGSVRFNLERMNELQVCATEDRDCGFRKTMVVREDHPYYSEWYPHLQGHVLGYEGTIVNELHHFLRAVAGEIPVEPYGATFEDGYKCALVCDAVLESARTGKVRQIDYSQC